MKPILLFSVAVLPTGLFAGELVRIVESDGFSSQASGHARSGAASRLNAGVQAPSLQGKAARAPMTGLIAAQGLDGQGHGPGAIGIVATPPAPQPVVIPEPQPIRFELRNLHFEYDSALLAKSDASVIADLASMIDLHMPSKITLIGHTDRRGTAAYNLELSERRASAVRDALTEGHGFHPSLFRIIGRGSEELLSSGMTEDDHARDRRVVVVFDLSREKDR